MTNRQIRVYRAAERFMPRLWAFAYPVTGRGWPRLRLWAFVLWARLFGFYVHNVEV